MEHAANEVLAILEQKGYTSYKVGGFVRDTLLQLPIHDIDIATSATPEQVMNLFSKVIPTGMKHGTVTIFYQGYWFEVTTFRQDHEYLNHRHPDQVTFVQDIKVDLSRRDFTINAMAMDRFGNLIDPFHGSQDLKDGLLRAVGQPLQRFEEDALRVLRGLRFSVRYALTIEPKTWDAMMKAGSLLLTISKERVRDEFSKMLEGRDGLKAVDLLSTKGLLPFLDWHELFVRLSERPGRDRFNRFTDTTSRWAALFYGNSLTEARWFLTRWRFSNKFSSEVLTYLEIAEKERLTEREGKVLLLEFGLETVTRARELVKLKSDNHEDHERWKRWKEELFLHHPKELQVTGRDLLENYKKPPGPWVKETLQMLFEKAAIEGIPNCREVLLKEARAINDNHEGSNIENV
ncbi:CCA tRNA nucleotidyltransferase [Ammoniphilus sp. YIM 78166]|uniref:CCA tRNA nucleotidyltransferase n=1 Tax=Ammoniphilus sp. YIM 78166 TaxID=1644106 RepID=UPI00106F67E0|nr:CCA tRNA nucleotidyltransferase [Ammoniphilus sp. YIM 78166]